MEAGEPGEAVEARVEVASAKGSGKLKGTWREKHFPQAPCIADMLQ